MASNSSPLLIIIMGTCGSGKSTIGLTLSNKLSIPFIDGDELHPKANVDKQARGEPLTDEDRKPWLRIIRLCALEIISHPEYYHNSPDTKEPPSSSNAEIRQILSTVTISRPSPSPLYHDRSPNFERKGVIIACSALKKSYRDYLRGFNDDDEGRQKMKTIFVYLKATPSLLLSRMSSRQNHFMKSSMLDSQLATLEEPSNDNDEVGIEFGGDGEEVLGADEDAEKAKGNVVGKGDVIITDIDRTPEEVSDLAEKGLRKLLPPLDRS